LSLLTVSRQSRRKGVQVAQPWRAQAACEGYSDFVGPQPSTDQPSFRSRCAIAGAVRRIDLGMLEPAYYVNVCPGTHASGKRMVSWHIHLICWGISPQEIKKRIKRLNDTPVYLPIADGLAAAHQKPSRGGNWLTSFATCSRPPPRKAYRLYRVERVTADGEIVLQKTSDLRPGERLTLLQLMQDMYLDRLALAGGQGADILRRAKRCALRHLSK
jgi:hypothetical protein